MKSGLGPRASGLGLIVALVASVDAEPNLKLTHEPPPRHLHMRPRTAAAPTTAAATPSPIPKPPPPGTDTPADATVIRDVLQPISVRFNLGYAVDGTAATEQPSLGGRVVAQNRDFSAIHAYGFGEGYFSTRGVGIDSLSTYLASRFILTQRQLVFDPSNPQADNSGHVVTPPPIANWFERSDFRPLTFWGEVSDFLGPKALAPLRVRAGAQYVYGPWVTHFYGLTAAWEGKIFKGQVYGGSRVPDYTASIGNADRAAIGGFDLRADLRDLTRRLPFVVSLDGLAFTDIAAGQTKPSNHTEVTVDWYPSRDLAVVGQARSLENKLANEHVQVRARYSQVTNFVLDYTHRTADDWRWDPSVVGNAATDPLAPKRYLDLGPVLGESVVSARGGTLVAENVDLYGRFAGAWVQNGQGTGSSYEANYREEGVALEVRLRRTIALGISGLSRQTDRPSDPKVMDISGTPQPLAIETNPAAMGERAFYEFGATTRMSLGARKFSALVEIYGRYTRYERDYCLDTRCGSSVDTGVPDSDLRGGGRVTVDAWVRDRLRLFAAYDLSSKLRFSPEITGYKSIRLVMEGVY